MNHVKLKQIRKAKGYTLSTLSSMTGCTSSFLSQLERGLKQPSLEMLRRISSCLEVPIFDLISESNFLKNDSPKKVDKKYNIIKYNNRKKVVMPEILTEYEFITPYSPDGSDNSRVVGMYISLLPGKWSCEKSVSLEYDISIFIVNGTVNITIENDTFTLGKGDSVYIYSGAPHNFFNAGDTELIMIGYGERK